MKQRPQNQQRRPERRSPESAMRAQSRRQEPRRDQRPQRQPAAMMPWEQEQERVRKEQLEYARQQAAAEGREAGKDPVQPAEQRAELQRPNERRKEKQVPALFGLVGRKSG
jgi:hypothetical protein